MNAAIQIGAEEVSTMQKEKRSIATLGDLIVAVTDEVSPLTNNPAKTNVLVSYILNDLFVTKRVRFRQHRIANARFGGWAMQVYVALQPLVALIAGILILIIPRLLNYIVAIYLIVIGILGLVKV
jgi:hypothetical protein